MRVKTLGFALALLTYGSAITVARADEKTVRKEIQAAYARSIKEIKAKDFKALEGHYTSDYTAKASNGMVMNRDQEIANLKLQLANPQVKIGEMSVKVGKISLKGKDAIADVTEKVSVLVP